MHADQGPKLLADALQDTQAVVAGQGFEKILDGIVGTGRVFDKFVDNLILVLHCQRWCRKNGW